MMLFYSKVSEPFFGHVVGVHVLCLAWLSFLLDSYHHDLEAVYELSSCQVSAINSTSVDS